MKLNIDKKAVGGRIRTIRLDRGLTLDEFGKIFIDIAKLQNVRSWEIGQSLPNKERIKTICKLFDITRNELLYGSIDEIIENNKELICKELNCNEDEFEEIIYLDIFEDKIKNIDIDLSYDKLIKEIKVVYEDTILDLEDKLDNLFNEIINHELIDEFLENNELNINLGLSFCGTKSIEGFILIYENERKHNIKDIIYNIELFEETKKELDKLKKENISKKIVNDELNLDELKKLQEEIALKIQQLENEEKDE